MRMMGEMIGFSVYLILLLGVVFGAAVGYEAGSVEDASIEYENEEMVVGQERTDVSLDLDEPDNTVDEVLSSHIEFVYHTALEYNAATADATASFFYENRSWIPATLVNGIFTVAALIPAVYGVLRSISILGRLHG